MQLKASNNIYYKNIITQFIYKIDRIYNKSSLNTKDHLSNLKNKEKYICKDEIQDALQEKKKKKKKEKKTGGSSIIQRLKR